MGYTTEFEGHFTIYPPLPLEKVEELRNFCGVRHGGNIRADEGCPSIWCDWTFSEDGTKMTWNGSEKSYSMTEWAVKLRNDFFPDHDVEGRIRARGEEFEDIWTMVADSESREIREESGW